jgi:phospholipase/lecithinase/hemolysin
MDTYLKKVKFAGVLCTVLFLLTPSLSFALKFKQIVTFGDSLSDHGNLQSQIPNQPATKSNGDVWVDYLKKELNAELTNYAVIGAMTSKHLKDDVQKMSDDGFILQLGLLAQIDRYIDQKPDDFDPSETLFTVWIGANNLIRLGYDIEAEVVANMENPDFNLEVTTQTMTQTMIEKAKVDITNAFNKILSNIGAKHIVVLTLPDIGKSPWYNQRSEAEIQSATTLASTYNYYLLLTVDQVVANYPDVTLYKFDLFEIMDEILAKDLFQNEVDSYMKLDDEGYALTETNDEPEENYLFYDAVHPMTRAHEYFSTVVAEGVLFHGYVTQQAFDDAVINERMKWDIKNDNRIGLEEAIHALKTCADMKTGQ